MHRAEDASGRPEAMLAALGITFPVNVLIGIPLYQQWLGWFY